jgi:hypothetical protein
MTPGEELSRQGSPEWKILEDGTTKGRKREREREREREKQVENSRSVPSLHSWYSMGSERQPNRHA